MLGNIYPLMQHNKPYNLNHQQHHCKNLISHSNVFVTMFRITFRHTKPLVKWVKHIPFPKMKLTTVLRLRLYGSVCPLPHVILAWSFMKCTDNFTHSCDTKYKLWRFIKIWLVPLSRNMTGLRACASAWTWMRRKSVKQVTDYGTRRHVSVGARRRKIALLDFTGSLHSASKWNWTLHQFN